MMPFSSSLSKYMPDIHDLDPFSDNTTSASDNVDLLNRSSPLSSYEIISCSSTDMLSLSDHPLLSEREAIKIKAQVD